MQSSLIGTLILIFTGMVTYQAFRRQSYMDENIFHVDKILKAKEYRRLFTSGFLHANWIHFGFNMGALMAFSIALESNFGYLKYFLLYMLSMLGGSLLSLYIHRNHGDYRALGASGAVSGVVMASIILYPESEISLVLIPISWESWKFGIAYIILSILGIKYQVGNIGHDAHLGGALTGVLLTIAFQPTIIYDSWWIILLIVIPVFIFLYLIIQQPEILMIDKYWGAQVENIKDFRKQRAKDPTLDELLEKIRKKGIKSLSTKERQLLEKYKNDI